MYVYIFLWSNFAFKGTDLRPYEIPRDILVEEDPWTPENGMLEWRRVKGFKVKVKGEVHLTPKL